jgi:hypothetical protein
MERYLRVMKPALRFRPANIRLLASQYDYGIDDKSLKTLVPKVVEQQFLTKQQLRVVAAWKSPRSAGYMESNQSQYVKEVTAIALCAVSERARIETLTLLDGVSWPTASVILHYFHRDRYPILDFRALWSVGLEPPPKYDFEFWWAYVKYCRALAKSNRIDMRTLDRALWQYSKEHQ